MPKYAMIVHGYSEHSLSAYAQFPRALKATAPELANIVLSAFNSLDDGVTIDDLAEALESRMSILEGQPNWDTSQAVFISHSTGALVVRRWMLNRLGTARPLPSHLITMAGANHGSSLAQLGATPLGYAERFLFDRILSVGKHVLTDLDYGSAFLLRLNREWLFKRYGSDEAPADPRLASVYQFSLGGDSLGNDKAVELLWASSERGSDNTVRISGANLNYTYLIADIGASTLKAMPSKPQAHLVIPSYSHYGTDTGILAKNTAASDPPMQAIREALNVATPAGYQAILDRWSARTADWNTGHSDQANATVVFNLHDRNGTQIEDCFIGFLDATVPGLDAEAPQANKSVLVDAMRAVSGSIEANQPIHNGAQRGSYSFYVNADTFNAMANHLITIEATPPGQVVTFGPLNFTVDRTTVERLVFANQFTYVDMMVPRYAEAAYALFDTTTNRADPQPLWPPFDTRGRIA